ncbi:MAG TPA: penicillin acylase family protein [Acidocella sp.]|uniref:penicillin acylase family protein n=1 Tax=Acidocella sp. TaxID=50710 RepID=UPI002D12FA10|nr:penicillin acylase family protein [Acidocella sp.]HVE23152.1 penicillin acylase family protein [Acidocella sp.]
MVSFNRNKLAAGEFPPIAQRRPLLWLRRGLAAGGALLLACIVLFLLLNRTLPAASGRFTLPGLSAPVTVIFDRHGIPFIRAASDTDAAEALGYLHARDRLFEMDLMRRAGSGTLAEILGPAALGNDEEMRRLGLRQSAQNDIADLSPAARAMLQSYADGVNAYIAERGRLAAPEFLLLGRPAPWTITDSLLWGKILGLWLSGNWRLELERLALSRRQPLDKIMGLWPSSVNEVPETAAFATPPSPALAAAAQASLSWVRHFPEPFTQPAEASNEWAVAGDRTASGHPLLAGDPHLGFGFPSLWYLARIDTPSGTLAGATAPGIPFMVIGHNDHIAWTFTTTGAAVQDVFIEHPTPDGKDYETPTGPQPFARRTEIIKILGRRPLTLTVLQTRHGPVIGATRDGKSLLAVAMANLAPHDTDADGLLALDRAGSVAAVAAAAAKITSPVQNLLVADAAHIGFYTTGRVPLRKAGDGTFPVDGADGAHDWTSLVTSAALPRAFDPPSGELINANNPTVGPDFPVFIARDNYGDWRARRIKFLLAGGTPQTPASFARIQLDTTSLFARAMLPRLLALALPPGDPAAPAFTMLRGWSGDMGADSPQPLIFSAWTRAFTIEILRRNGLDPETAPVVDDFLPSLLGPNASPAAVRLWCAGDCGPALHASLETAMAALSGAYGRDPSAWRWSQAHPAHFAHAILGALPVIGRFGKFSIPVPGDAMTIDVTGAYLVDPSETRFTAVNGPEFRAVFDLANLDASLFVIAPGESGNLFSRHAADFLHRWRDGQNTTLGANPVAAGAIMLEPPAARRD